ncbi:TonB-dependent receptor [uncultured Oceanisphaera sp.]|uniref:TonB-dependent receptor domain-containing protein n=1 Tax=uncultured Oceanisphaera sp. TaxID=353858 RepID=UPI00261B7621|nr:TonB-dependent receptor [uncultured Oceanisphaera sp.]
MSKKLLAVALLPWAAFAQNSSDSTNITIYNRVEQPRATVLAPVEVITAKEIRQRNVKSLPDALRYLPGIDIGQNGGRGQLASVFIRGAESDHTLMLVDGVRMTRSVVGGADFNQFPVALIERIEYIRGPRAAIYGSDAIGGVINIITKGQQGDDLNLIDVGIGSRGYQQATGLSSLAVSDSTHVKAAISYEAEDGYNVHPDWASPSTEHGFRGKSGMLNLNHDVNQYWRAFGAVRKYENKVEYDGFGSLLERDVEALDASGGVEYRNEHYRSELTYGYGRQYDYDHAPEVDKRSGSLLFIRQHNATWLNTIKPANDWTLNLGIDWRREQVLPGTNNNSANRERDNEAAFVTLMWAPAPWFLEGSVRADDNEQFGTHNTWQLALGRALSDEVTVSLGAGTAFKAPTFYHLYGFAGNPDLVPEESEYWEASIKGNHESFQWRVSAYRNLIDQIIVAEEVGNFVYLNKNINQADIKGLEFELGFDTGPIRHDLTLEYLDANNEELDRQLARRAKHKAKWQGGVAFGDTEVALSYLYQGERFDADSEFSDTINPSYSLWDLALVQHLTPNLELRGRIANLFDKEYELASGYPAAERAYYLNASYRF